MPAQEITTIVNNDTLHMTSREIAELTGKQHSHVIRDIQSMLSQLYPDDPKLDHVEKYGVFIERDNRNYIALIKLDKDTLTQWLIENRYCYREVLNNELRAYSQFAHLFKLEAEVINGMPRRLLKVTGAGFFELTPTIAAYFHAKQLAMVA